MADSSYLRGKAEQALRLARQNTDPMLIDSLTELAREYLAQADATDGIALDIALGEDPKEE